jgi:serine protease
MSAYYPNDQFYSAQWGMQRIGMESVWQPSFSLGSGIIVAVVDTGIYPDHPDFEGTNILTNSDWDFVDGDADTRPTKICNRFHSAEFHATFVAGIIAATSDNGVDVAGIGPFDILPVRVLDHCGSGSSSDVANGILWAKNNGADVINLSLGSSSPSTVILNAINEAHTADVIIVAASGNDGNDSVLYPAGFPNVISVGAIINTDARASYSQYGNTLELAAPGGSSGTCSPPVTPYIVSTGLVLNGKTPVFAYQCGTGTSFAAPHVSGVAGLVRAANPSATNEEIRLHLQQTSEDLGPDGYDIEFGYGLVNATAALSISINSVNPPSLVAHYEFEDDLSDSTGNGNDGCTRGSRCVESVRGSCSK